jgi:hypothetical protein
MEDELLRLESLHGRQAIVKCRRVGETHRKLEDGVARPRESVGFLAEENVVTLPVLGEREALVKPPVLVRFGEQPWTARGGTREEK